ncbi:O-methyltransferase [Flavobacterium caeni]|uniref:Caffeoyl-CoA O-methyltransferase n=1 Tax=Flavobacterium caeni TaxID=490189 RepID=A0A1G5FBU3_9FLAO|nr:O-methyltransferase [Flavobacterium caeni]SCY36683.1 caffeoyl-CoA O-methyltransferase [Flavobacterium caeni]
MERTLFEKVDHYIAGLTAKENPALLHATATIDGANLFNQSISAVQGKMLQVFLKACNAQRVLELGTFRAYSTIWLAQGLPKNGKLVTIEFDQTHAEVARQNIEHAHLETIVELKVGNALEILATMIQDNEPPFDLFFIDADKPPYLEYFQMALKMSRKGSIIICDNVIRNGKVLDEDSTDEKVRGVQRLNDFLKNCDQVTATILQTVGTKEYDGMLIAVVN